MKFRIKHEIEGRIRIEAVQNRMTFEQADTLQYYLDDLPFVKSASVQERTQSVTVCYDGDSSIDDPRRLQDGRQHNVPAGYR